MTIVDVLLSTYNGKSYLAELLESLDQQTFADWRLLVRDDGSSDASLDIIKRWRSKAGIRASIIEDSRSRLGAAASFSALLQASDAPYFMLCDQDDVWLPDKMSQLLRLVQQAEEHTGRGTPVVAHTDLIVVDNDLQQVHSSFWRYQRLVKPSIGRPYERLVIQNCVTGCASMGNASLRSMALPIPEEAMMHDWWLALVAGTFGEIIEEKEPLVLYRQHGSNTLGARAWSVSLALRRLIRDPAVSVERAHVILRGTQRQAKVFADRFAESLQPAAAAFFLEYGSLSGRSLLRRKSFPFRYHLWSEDFLRNCSLFAFI